MMNLFDHIQKPTLLLDIDKAKANIHAMAAKARRWGVTFRPHFKTHQSAQVGEWFRDEGVEAITVSSLEMANYFSQHGWTDITVAFPFNPRQMEGYNRLAQQIKLGIVVEADEMVDFLAAHAKAGMDVWVKVDVGSHRTGIAVDEVETVWSLIQRITAVKNLHLQGLLTHAGMTYRQSNTAAVVALNQQSVDGLNHLRDALHLRGAPGLLISVGDTPACSLCDPIGRVDEIRPGNFVFYDAMQLAHGVCAFEQVAVALVCPVVAKHADRNEVVIHGGDVHLSSEYYEQDGKRIFGMVSLPEGASWGKPLAETFVTRLSQEHGIISASRQAFERISAGDLVCVLPAHSCITVASMRRYLTTTGDWIDALGYTPLREP
ncbi:MAG: alanine racemase [Anaerolineae bacterium]|nr:alanine racemase [Anaerolineae bacterium]